MCGKHAILRTLKADWLNGVAKDDQKAKAKSLIQLSLSHVDAAALANVAAVDPGELQSAVQKKVSGQDAAPEEASALKQFDAVLTAVIDTAYERGEQEYRNAAKFLAMVTSVVLGGMGGLIVFGANLTDRTNLTDLAFCLLAGLVATPLAPVAKDLASALRTAVAAASALKPDSGKKQRALGARPDRYRDRSLLQVSQLRLPLRG